VNELTNSIPKDGRSLSDLLESSEFDPEQWRVRRTGGAIVLERIGEPAGIPPGYYTKETLPPLSDGARAILASVDAAVAKMAARKGAESGASRHRGPVTLDDDGAPGLTLSDDGLPGIDPGD
jgi:hypothetical protein